ncbi:MAG: AraC family transcriptional regulator [Planctomycetes bacterium]|nr:AraC family transcriptional regulator [Planctomycetota bacterium]MBI3843432.1 AraC family transcriptional regulator [Planctomycetota bacterium]
MIQRPTYREFPPSAALAGVVGCYWSISSDAALREAVPCRVMPDGCLDFVWTIGDSVRRGIVVGAMTRATVVQLESRVDVMGVRFRPGAAGVLLGLPLCEITDQAIALGDLWSRDGARIDADLAEAPSIAARVSLLDRFLSVRLRGVSARDRLVARAIDAVQSSRGLLSVDGLAASTGLGGRQLERLFAVGVGIGPKAFCRVARFRNAISILTHRPSVGWTTLACDAGYFDQSHLIREFKQFAGVAPGEYRRELHDVGFVQYDPPSAR